MLKVNTSVPNNALTHDKNHCNTRPPVANGFILVKNIK